MDVCRLSTGERVGLDALSYDELCKLQYEEERFVAARALKLPPFSSERRKLLKDGYQLDIEIKNARAAKESRHPKSYGASWSSVYLLSKLIRKHRKKSKTEKTALYEVGVGMGFALRYILERHGAQGLEIKGCDHVLHDNARKLAQEHENVKLVEGDAYDCIKDLPDASIDIMYADNVFEHFLPDEAPYIYGEVSKKLKPGALLFMVIPNSMCGPYDISGRFLEMGEKARGLHFMEQSFNEVTEAFAKYNIRHRHSVCRIPHTRITFLCGGGAHILAKLRIEPAVAKLKIKFLRAQLCYGLGYSFYVMAKQG